MDDGEGVSIQGLAKGEQTKQLSLFLIPSFHRQFMGLLKQAEGEETNANRHLRKFQELLEQVPEWNVDKVERETHTIISQVTCDQLEELMTAVFIAHTKILTAIRIGKKSSRVQITIPKLEHFIHRSLSECSRLLWSSVQLFHADQSALDRQRSHRQVEALLHEGISQAIRGLLPVKSILKEQLAEPENADADDDDDEEDEKEEKETAKEAAKEVKEEPVEAKDEAAETVEPVPAEPVEPEVAEPIPAPVETEKPVLTIPESSSPPIPIEMPEPPAAAPPAPVEQPSQPPTLVVSTEPSVHFSNQDQVIQPGQNGTQFQYVEKDRDAEEEREDDDDEDEEDILDGPVEAMSLDDFETLG